jgi:DNA-binding NarL/FixJ family response regulator
LTHSIKEHPARKKIRVCILSSHPLVLPEWRRLLARAGFEVHVRQVELTPKTDLHSLNLPAASIYVVDAHGTDWATEALVAAVRLHHPEARIVVVGPRFSEVNSFPLFYLGVKGLVKYSEVRRQLSRAVYIVAGGGLWASRTLMTKFVESLLGRLNATRRRAPRSRILSRRENEILDCLLKNRSNKEIAEQLHVSESTVKFHVSNILAKFGVQRRTDLILSYFQDTVA